MIFLCKIFSHLFSDISIEPKVSEVKNAFFALKKSKATLILAIGGGNVIDLAKAVSIIATNEKFCDVVLVMSHFHKLCYCYHIDKC